MATQYKDSVPVLGNNGSSLVFAGFLGEQKLKLNRHKAFEDFPWKPESVYFFSRLRLVGSSCNQSELES